MGRLLGHDAFPIQQNRENAHPWRSSWAATASNASRMPHTGSITGETLHVDAGFHIEEMVFH